MQMSDRFVIITGGPSAGKSTLIDCLAGRGYGSTLEAGRAILQAQASIAEPPLPWADQLLFAELILSWELRSYRAATEHDGLVFFDRGLPEVVGFYTQDGLAVPPHFRNAAARYRYHPRVFIAPPWQAIFTQDQERTQTYDDALRQHDVLVDCYTAAGYELVTLPLVSAEARASFVLEKLSF